MKIHNKAPENTWFLTLMGLCVCTTGLRLNLTQLGIHTRTGNLSVPIFVMDKEKVKR